MWRNFLWRNNYENRVIHLLRRSKVTAPIDKSGLGITRIKDTNFFLLTKWLWRFYLEQKPLWKRLIWDKYDLESIGSIPTKSKYSSNKAPWISITKGISWFLEQTKWKINDGKKTSFCHVICLN